MRRAVFLAPILLAAGLMAGAQITRAFDILGAKVGANSISKNPGYSGQVKPLEEPFIEMLRKLAAEDANKSHIELLLNEQESYDFNTRFTTTDILYRTGFHYELHNSTSPDGYVTQLVRILNPKVRRSKVKQPPVVLYAGQGVSPAAFLMTALTQVKPEAWPRDSPWTQNASRSLAFTLSNSGYDVWLVPARGVDQANRARIKSPPQGHMKRLLDQMGAFGKTKKGALTVPKADELKKLAKELDSHNYWSFTDDNIIQLEFGVQLRLVMAASGCSKLSLISYSNGGFITFGFMASQPEFVQRHLDAVISIAPAVFVDRHNLVLGASGLLSRFTPPGMPHPTDQLDKLARRGFTHLCRPKSLRYSVCKLLLNQLYGDSDLFSTHIELNLVDFVGRPMSARGLRQTLQVGASGEFRRFDYGPLGNLLAYDQTYAPAYGLASVHHERQFIISGSKDSIVSTRSVAKLMAELEVRPTHWIQVAGYNHLDLLAGHDNAKRVNLPILRILDDRNLEEDYYRENGHELEVEFNHKGARNI